MKAPFPIDPHLTAIATAYTNERMIADSVLPRFGVGKQEFNYKSYAKGDSFTIPNTLVGRKSKPKEVEFKATEVTDSTRDYGLEDAIPIADIENADGSPIDPVDHAAEMLSDIIELDREKRVADLVFNEATYPVGSKQTLSGVQQWSDFVNSDPIGDIMGGLDSMIIRANTLTLGRAVFTKLVQHPQIVKAFHGNEGDSGVATRQFIAQLFELDEVLVGEGWLNTAKQGQAVTLARLWAKHASLLVRNPLATTRQGITFGLTAEWETRVAGQREDPDIGLRGGVRLRVGESVKEFIVASDTGYFFEDAVA